MGDSGLQKLAYGLLIALILYVSLTWGGPDGTTVQRRIQPWRWQGTNRSETGKTVARWRTCEPAVLCPSAFGAQSLSGRACADAAISGRAWQYPAGRLADPRRAARKEKEEKKKKKKKIIKKKKKKKKKKK